MKSLHTIVTPGQFRFHSTVFSHGWSALLPYRVTEAPLTLWRDLNISARSIVRVELQKAPRNNIQVALHTSSELQPSTIAAITDRIISLMQVDLNLGQFYKMVRHDDRFSWAIKAGAGRMLRGDTFFEDAVKTILTTNCSW